MRNDFDRDLRELFLRHEMDMASRGLTPPQNLRRRTRRRQAATLLVASVAAVAIAIAGIAGFDAIRTSERRPAKIGPGPTQKVDWESLPGVNIDGDAIVDLRTGAVTPLPTGFASLDSPGSYSVAPGGEVLFLEARTGGSSDNPFTTCPDHDDEGPPDSVCQIFVANVDGTRLRQLTDTPGGAAAEGWSPNGTKIVAVLDGGTANDIGKDRLLIDLVLIDVATGETTTIASGPAGDFGSPSFGPDGQHILFWRYTEHEGGPSDPGPDLFQIPIDGGDVTLVLENGYDARVSPDGQRMVFTKAVFVETSSHSGHGGGELWLAGADGTDPHPLIADDPFSSRASWSPDGSRLVFWRSHVDEQTSRYVDDGVVVFDLTAGEPTYLVKTAGRFATGTWLDDDTLLVDVG